MVVNNDISGTVFDSLQTYAGITGTTEDDAILEQLSQLILDAVPGADPAEVGDKIDEILEKNPNWTMDQVLEAVVTALNPDCEADDISAIKSTWESFTQVSDLTTDDVTDILEDPVGFTEKESDSSTTSLKDALKVLLLLLVELAGEESAAMLTQGVAERDNIEALGEKKASDIITKGWVDGAIQGLSGACSIGGGIGSAVSAAKGFKAGNELGNITPDESGKISDVDQMKSKSITAKAQAWGNTGQALSSFCSGLSSLCSGGGSVVTGFIDADIAIIDSESQQAGIRKDTDDQLKNTASTLMDTALQLLKTMGQADYQTMTAIGRA